MMFQNAEVKDGKLIVSREELEKALSYHIDEMSICKQKNDYEMWVFRAGQVKVLREILKHFKDYQ